MANNKFVTLYSVIFQGLYGRNRTPKFYSSSANLVADESKGEDQAWLKEVADKELALIKAKKGKVKVSRYLNCEVNTYESNGRILTSYSIPITCGQTVYSQDVG